MKQISRQCITKEEYAVYIAIKTLLKWKDEYPVQQGAHINIDKIIEITQLSKYKVQRALAHINQRCMNSLLLVIWYPGRCNYYEIIGEVIE